MLEEIKIKSAHATGCKSNLPVWAKSANVFVDKNPEITSECTSLRKTDEAKEKMFAEFVSLRHRKQTISQIKKHLAINNATMKEIKKMAVARGAW